MREYIWRADPEKRKRLESQWEAAVLGTVTCACGQARALTMAYRCLYCGEWFCVNCAEQHFGETIQEWIERKRVDVRQQLKTKTEEEILNSRKQRSAADESLSQFWG